ncbi:MAG: carboxypeptidase regulatory-like domain-containing protein, partial [Acidobacteria bacterium]|nr:carboxypeptidase regulatory-like domain-containing protein [Acidobacteriota bacterium]
PTGAVVVGAAVRVRNVDTNLALDTRSNEQGNYQLPFLPPGNYAVTVEHPGFRNIERPSVHVSINSQVTLDFALELGAAAETVTIRSAPPLLTTVGADLGQVVDNAYVGAISVSLTRNVINLTRLAPGVTGDTGTYSSNAQSNFSISGGGSTRGRNEFLVDGIPNTIPQGGGLIVFVPSVDSVEEVKVHTTMFDAAYGHSNGGAVNITTRGGTNQLHGALYDFKRWRALNANSWTNKRLGLPKPPVDYNQWGYTAGGPVWLPRVYDGRNRTFFSTSLERDNDARELSRQARVPTELERNGDFSQTLNRLGGPFSLFDPASTTVAGGRATRIEFPGARIPADRLSPIGLAVMKAYPAPNQAGPSQIGRLNWASTAVYTVAQSQESARIDHVLSARQRLFGRVSRLVRDQHSDTLFPGVLDFPAEGSSDLGKDLRHFTSIALDDTFIFSPSFLGSLRYGFSRRFSDVSNGALGFNPADLRLPASLTASQSIPGYPIFRLGENVATIGTTASNEANDLHALLATFTKLTGRHSLKFGADYRLVRWNRLSQGSQAVGDFTFNPVFTQADPSTNSSADRSGSAMASLLLAAPASGSLGYNSPLSLQNHYVAGFMQEDWKLSTRLTLNFGLRYELETPYTERYNRASYGFDSTAKLPVQVPGLDLRGGILFAGVDGRPRREGSVDTNNFGPRFGFALAANSKTVVRGGYGLFYSGQSYNSGFLGQVGVFDASTPYVGSIDGGATIFTTLANPFPNGLRRPVGSSAGLLARLGDSLSFFNADRVSPYNQQWQFSIQRELPSQILVEAAYLGMLSLKQFESFDLNEKPDRYLAEGANENRAVPNPFLGVFPATSALGTGSTIVQRRLWPAFPQFTSLTVEGANTGRAIYHALQLKVEKRLTHGLNFVWNYTASKLMDNNTTSIVNPRHYRSISNLDQAQLMRLAFTYQLPFRVESRLARQAAEGWSLSGFLNLASGLPLSISQANGRPIRIRNPRKSGPIVERLNEYFDTKAFVPLPNQYTVSPEPPNLAELRAPGARSLNLSLFKTFPLRERLRLEVRAEMANFTNTPNFGAPGANMSNAATFGVINSAGGSRSMQLGGRLVF